MKNIVFSICCLSVSAMSFAALPPYYSSTREMKAILDSKDVAEKLAAQGTVTAIVYENSSYIVIAGDCSLKVKVVYQPSEPGLAGAGQFDLKLNEMNCLPEQP
jgi:hypothetical protein